MSLRTNIRNWLYWKLYPGMNLHARLRYEFLPNYFGGSRESPVKVLDAGSGNGMLTYKSYQRGNEVLGISFKKSEVEKSRKLFNEYLGIPRSRLQFECGNLYDLDSLEDESFDEIICSETLEHLRRDAEVCRSFWRLLKPGGVLHACAPNGEHPYNANFPLDEGENGGHVRPGYTIDSYHNLLEPLGFEVAETAGLGGPLRQWFNRRIKETQERWGAPAGIPWFAIAMLLLRFQRRDVNTVMPFSLYVRARKQLK